MNNLLPLSMPTDSAAPPAPTEDWDCLLQDISTRLQQAARSSLSNADETAEPGRRSRQTVLEEDSLPHIAMACATALQSLHKDLTRRAKAAATAGTAVGAGQGAIGTGPRDGAPRAAPRHTPHTTHHTPHPAPRTTTHTRHCTIRPWCAPASALPCAPQTATLRRVCWTAPTQRCTAMHRAAPDRRCNTHFAFLEPLGTKLSPPDRPRPLGQKEERR
jgi:hypothetical protein